MNEDEVNELRRRDALALAELIYDIYIEKEQGEMNDVKEA